MYYNTSYVATLEYKGLSLPLMLRQFTLHKSAVQCGSDTATEAKYTRLQPADRGGAAPGAGLHVQPRPQCFSLVSGKVMTSTPW